MSILQEKFEHKETSDFVVFFKGKWFGFPTPDEAQEFYDEKKAEIEKERELYFK